MQMLESNYLTLRLVRLKRYETWPNDAPGLSIVLPKGGSGRYICNSFAQSLSPGDVIVLNSTVAGKIVVASDEMTFWCFSVCFEHLFPLFNASEVSLLQGTTESLKDPKLYPGSSALAQECHRLVVSAPPQGNVDHRSQVLRVAAAILSAEFKNVRSKGVGFVRMEDHMMQVFDKLSTTELLTFSVGEMAHKFGCSRRHLNRLFHQHFGCSVASLRMEMRLMKALSLLRNPNLKVINVAEQCGFNHLGLFNACFKKRFGNTPGQWRKRSANGNNNLHDNDSCSMQSNPENRTPKDRKKNPPQESNHATAPGVTELRNIVVQNINKGSPQMRFSASLGANLRNRI